MGKEGCEYLSGEIDALAAQCPHKTLALWACDCAGHVLPLYEKRFPGDDRPRRAIEACLSWVRGETPMWEARKAAFPAHAAAREADDEAARAAARACGHAVGTAHVPSHAPHCAAYAAKARSCAGGDVREEREWQYLRLKTWRDARTGRETE